MGVFWAPIRSKSSSHVKNELCVSCADAGWLHSERNWPHTCLLIDGMMDDLSQSLLDLEVLFCFFKLKKCRRNKWKREQNYFLRKCLCVCVCEVKMKYVGEYPVSGTKQFHEYLRFQKKSNQNWKICKNHVNFWFVDFDWLLYSQI